MLINPYEYVVSSGPSTIPNLIQWFKGDLLGAGGSYPSFPNSAPGGSSPWALSTGSGISVADTLNSLNVATFNATNYVLPMGDNLVNGTIFYVLKPVTLGGGVFLSGVFAGGELGTYITAGGNFSFAVFSVATPPSSTATIVPGTWYQMNVAFAGASGAYAYRHARAAENSGVQVEVPTTPNESVGTVGGGSVEIAEMIVYNRTLTPTEIAYIEAYLFAKWGV